MFSGIVETMGVIKEVVIADGCHHLTITPSILFDDLKIGDSVAVNGVCLTVTHFTPHDFNVTVVPETLRLTNLNHIQTNDTVNLERSITLNTRLGGHYVQGHVDGTGQILEIKADHSDALLVKISIPAHLAKYVVPKGYITLDGMSITVIEATQNWFTVTFIPHTQAVTNVHRYEIDQLINIEVDIMGKYVERLLGVQACNQL